ncbi:Putative ribonuclease H-like superfamily, mitochondrial resolvase Ydc2, catalytic [Septoria linicola]|uniref:Ribonuclease H-like superfamily, mitochondrial resolvase Ydc2, catalytic n=1 Tax=Septoria linicola TaxID=215465 RepID=A0A9Q9B6U5_9PEZI|nr:putative ribonuclease H-like superfamily, mitochondrial resolvase Ydc2, catalytic [Septoria linicola]USW58513.1 Putative ribonuclease H-like superfamily, mitochondrial resolvase Ydc2, catalytic [Septoria linicola]
MAAIRNVDHLKVWQLKYWAFLTGTSSPTKKAELQAALVQGLGCIRPNTGQRVVSVDMGIRNLAYCVVDVKPLSRIKDSSRTFTVSSWTRRDLLKPTAPEVSPLQNFASESTTTDSGEQLKRKLDTTAFTPAQLSKTAYNLVTSLLSHKPDDILIEQQRFRSGGATAIQEWTVRVNMLESMLWASLETLKASGPAKAFFPDVHAVAPRRVAEFWLSGQHVSLMPLDNMFEASSQKDVTAADTKSRRPRFKIEKKEKVDLVKKWVTGTGEGTNVNLEFKGQAAHVAQAFREQTSRSATKIAGGKLDDLADCLLQAIAHLRWEGNKRIIREMLSEEPA